MLAKDTARTISIRASTTYIEAINHIARRKGMKTADLVRGILDTHLKDELASSLSFFENDGLQIDQSVEKNGEHA